MSLKLFRGDEVGQRPAIPSADEPRILNYESYATRWRRYRNTPVNRARSLRTNDRCPKCSRGVVEPLELADGLRSRNNLPVPGTATLVGFHCLHCDWEWPA